MRALAAVLLITAVIAGAAAQVAPAKVAPTSPTAAHAVPPIRIRLPPSLFPVAIQTVKVTRTWKTSVADLAATIFESDAQYALPEAINALGQLHRRGGYQRLMVNAFCMGADALAETASDFPAYATRQEWRRYLTAFAQAYWDEFLKSFSQPYAASVIETWLNVGKVASVSNWRAAWLYVRACGL